MQQVLSGADQLRRDGWLGRLRQTCRHGDDEFSSRMKNKVKVAVLIVRFIFIFSIYMFFCIASMNEAKTGSVVLMFHVKHDPRRMRPGIMFLFYLIMGCLYLADQPV